MTKAFLICTFVLLVAQHAASVSVKAVPVAAGVKSEVKKEVVPVNKPVAVEAKSKDEEYKAQIESGTNIQGEGPYVVDAAQLPQQDREEVMKLLNTQYRLSEQKKQQAAAPEFKVEGVKSQFRPSEDDSFDPELASGIAQLLTRIAVEDEDGNQFLDLGELPVELREQVANYLTKQEQVDPDTIVDDLIKEQIMAEDDENSKPISSPVASPQLFNKNQPSINQLVTLLNSLVGGAAGDYPAYGAAGYYPGAGYGSYGGYPAKQQYGGYSQYGQLAGYPVRGQQGSGYYDYPKQPHGIVVNRQQLAALLASDPSLAAHVVPLSGFNAGSTPGYHFGQPSYNRKPKPQQFYQAANPFAYGTVNPGQFSGYPYHGQGDQVDHYPGVPALGQFSPSGPKQSNGIVIDRDQLATLLASDPSLAAHVVPLNAEPTPAYHFGQPSYNKQYKPQPFYQSANPLAAYYQQFLKSQQYQPSIAGVKYAQPAGESYIYPSFLKKSQRF